ncbi:hypothetical protein BU16DRAFT_289046 [Lophium mytilinum]|uniref:Uncharacterized protein n=1 Tax=Lophium mytilinum TaxID=390894 RepID=A0A6A6R1A6_9PEZI|nr:hypothetical protein BU16DRAFT_289046 [Lophium mytilinum]
MSIGIELKRVAPTWYASPFFHGRSMMLPSTALVVDLGQGLGRLARLTCRPHPCLAIFAGTKFRESVRRDGQGLCGSCSPFSTNFLHRAPAITTPRCWSRPLSTPSRMCSCIVSTATAGLVWTALTMPAQLNIPCTASRRVREQSGPLFPGFTTMREQAEVTAVRLCAWLWRSEAGV